MSAKGFTCPWAIAPITIAMGESSVGTSSLGCTNFSALKLVPIFLHPTGRCDVIGFLMTCCYNKC